MIMSLMDFLGKALAYSWPFLAMVLSFYVVFREPRKRPGIGNDGLTQGERAELTARYERGVGATPVSSPERTERINSEGEAL